jgi:hypothetical protein
LGEKTVFHSHLEKIPIAPKKVEHAPQMDSLKRRSAPSTGKP